MVFEITSFYYLLSTIAQALAALLGISGMFFVYYAQRIEQKKKERLEILREELCRWSEFISDQKKAREALIIKSEEELIKHAKEHIKGWEKRGKLSNYEKKHIQRAKEYLVNYNKYIIIESSEFKWLFALSLSLITFSILAIPFSSFFHKNIFWGNAMLLIVFGLIILIAFKFYGIFRKIIA